MTFLFFAFILLLALGAAQRPSRKRRRAQAAVEAVRKMSHAGAPPGPVAAAAPLSPPPTSTHPRQIQAAIDAYAQDEHLSFVPRKVGEKGVFLVAGYTHPNHHGVVRKSIYKHLAEGQSLRLVREPDNPYDPNAICIYAADGPTKELDLGFIRRRCARTMAAQMDKGAVYEATVLRVVSYAGGQIRKLYVEVTLATAAPRKKRIRRSTLHKDNSTSAEVRSA